MKLKDAILLLLYANDCEPITSMLHLKSMLNHVFQCMNLKLDDNGLPIVDSL